MQLDDAILGLVSCAPMSGYDLKKTLSRSPLFGWSGGSNQVYKALGELEKAGYLESELVPGVAAPAKKAYRVTKRGLDHLRKSALELPEPPSVRRPFALQLLFGAGVSREELAAQLDAYEGEVRGMMVAASVELLPGITEISAYQRAVLDACAESFTEFYSGELAWIDHVRTGVLPLAASHPTPVIREKLVCEVREVDGVRFVAVVRGQLRQDGDGLAIVTACVENDINLALLPASCLAEEFRSLSSRVAGSIVGKLANYRIRAAAVLDPETASGAFQSFALEANRGNQFHVTASEAQAIAWLKAGGV
ncbi:MAG: PadR family transcriptional regulator [Propionibacteriaceae bacterium]|jgi:DNA-binding PadR family transcriptional regulator|nr:PadR family transcriptional regulator [Propionibacteriaceae bacterium]